MLGRHAIDFVLHNDSIAAVVGQKHWPDDGEARKDGAQKWGVQPSAERTHLQQPITPRIASQFQKLVS